MGRLIRLRIHLLDKPGALLELTSTIAKHRVNIVDTLYNRAYYGVNRRAIRPSISRWKRAALSR